ncbi:MAG: calcium-binding protein [Gaiellales bacterium]
MSTAPTRKGRRRATLLAAFVGVVGVFLSLGVGSASAAATCSYNAATDTATITLLNDTAVVSKGSLNHLNVNGVWCSPALVNGDTNNNGVQYVVVVGNGTADALVLDESGGMFEPGIIADADSTLPPGIEGKNDVEFVLTSTVAGGGVEALSILGNAAADTITIGYDSLYGQSLDSEGTAAVIGAVYGIVNLNDDEDADVWLTGGTIYPAAISADGRGGNDVISGKGSHGTGPAHGVGDPFGSNGLILSGGAGNDHLQGGENDDWLIGGAGDDVIDGNGSDESPFDGAECSVQIDISTGNLEWLEEPWVTGDTVDYTGSTGPVTVDLDPGEVQGLGSGSGPDVGTDVLQNIENVLGSPGNDSISGDNANNLLAGGAGDDTIAGDAGDDCEWGNDGNDTFNENEGTSQAQGGTGTNNGSDLMVGGAGLDDTITYSERSTRVVVYLEPLPNEADGGEGGCWDDQNQNNYGLVRDGADLNGDGDSWDAPDEGDCVFLDTENAVTGSGNDVLFAAYTNNRADNEFTGGAGNDVEIAGAGNDVFHEGAAANGADDMDGGTGSDTCDYAARSNSVSVSLDGVDNDGEAGEGDNCGGVDPAWVPYENFRSSGWLGGDEGNPLSGQDVENVNGGSGNDQLVGSDAGNVLNGNAGNDALTGGGSTDTLNGGDGDDWISGGGGNDAINGGNGTDTGDYSNAGSGGVGVNVNLTTGQASGEGNDTLSGVENANGSSFADALRGDAGNNTLNGRGGADAIQGAAGDDTINGGDGTDELGGGAGNDRVSGAGGADAISGNGGDDNLAGGPGADTLKGGGGDDVISGNAQKDFMRGGPGTDRCNPGTPGFARGDVAVGCES